MLWFIAELASANLDLEEAIGEKASEDIVVKVKRDFQHAGISEKLKALLVIAGQVQRGGKNVTAEAVETARNLGATDLEIHDTVLIAAAFCMFNRYVDGLATWQPEDEAMYRERGKQYCARRLRHRKQGIPPRTSSGIAEIVILNEAQRSEGSAVPAMPR